METGRYDTSSSPDDQYEPGSRGRILKNSQGIRTKRDMGEAESEALKRATKWAIENYSQDHVFAADDIRKLHRVWLGHIYAWAGQYRQVLMSKDNFTFAFPEHLPGLMGELENGLLRRYTPCQAGSLDKLTEALAIIHVELLLIHPFREGNGRIARLLATLMALQAGMPLLDFSGIKGKKINEYFAAVQDGIDRNYDPMKEIFSGVISLTLKAAGPGKAS